MSFIGYISRTAEQMWADIKQVMPYHIPEIKDYDKDIFVRGLKLFLNVVQGLHAYLDNHARESFLMTCKRFSSAVLHARNADYRVKGVQAERANITLNLNLLTASDFTIPAETEFRTEEGITFTNPEDIIFPQNQDTIELEVLQRVKIEAETIGLTNNQANQKFTLGSDVLDKSISVQIGSEIYTQVETFYYSGPNDLHFVQSINEDFQTEIRFGDSKNGKIPPANQSVIATYYISQGLQGRVGRNQIVEIDSNLVLPDGYEMTCINEESSFGGKDVESIAEIQRNVPLHQFILAGAVNINTYVKVAESVSGVLRAGVEYNFGTQVAVYIVTETGEPASPSFLSVVKAELDKQKIICTDVQVYSAGRVPIILNMDLEILEGFDSDDILASVKSTLLSYGSPQNQMIRGATSTSEIYKVVMNVEGVKRSKINFINLKPYPQRLVGSNVLDAEIEMLLGSTYTAEWRIQFVSPTTFQLTRNNNFVGNFATNILIEQPEINLTVNGTYATGDVWIFRTYNYLTSESGTIQLQEPSLLAVLEEDLTLNIL